MQGGAGIQQDDLLDDLLEPLLAYHQLSKHYLQGYAPGPEFGGYSDTRSLLSPLCGLNRPEYAEVEQEYPQWVCQLHFSYSENATADLYSIAQGYSGTGIGCFFDDTIHELIGLQSQS